MTAYISTQHILIVTYNLKGPASSYAQFYEVLKGQGPWWHYLPSTWLIHSTKTPQEVADAARVHILTGDHLLVGTLQNGYSGWLPKDAWDWLKSKGLNP